VDSLEETILAQTLHLSFKPGKIAVTFKFRNKRGGINMVNEIGHERRKKLLHIKLKIGWLISRVGDYLVAKRNLKCSRYNHGHPDSRGEETCLSVQEATH
jgi:hypothetical protein